MNWRYLADGPSNLASKPRTPWATAQKNSIVGEVDFELELIHRDEINFTYILALLLGILEQENSLD